MLERLGPYALATPLWEEGGCETRHATKVDDASGTSVRIDALRVGAALDPAVRERFTVAAESARLVQHPGLVPLIDHGIDAGYAYVVYAPFAHKPLREIMQASDGRLSPDRVALLGADLADALAHAHSRQPPLVHRGVCPDLVWVDDQGRARLHGLAMVALAQAVAPRSGDMAYRSPEIVNGQDVSQRSDLFSLGSTLYEALAGRPAFDGPTALATSLKIRMATIEPLATHAPNAPASLRNAIEALLALDPTARPSAASASDTLSTHASNARADREALGKLSVPPVAPKQTPVARSLATVDEQPPSVLDESTERRPVLPRARPHAEKTVEDLSFDMISHEMERVDPNAFAGAPAEPTMRQDSMPDTAELPAPPGMDEAKTDMSIPLPVAASSGPITSGPVVLIRKADLEAAGGGPSQAPPPVPPPTERKVELPIGLLVGGGAVAFVVVLLTALLAAWVASS